MAEEGLICFGMTLINYASHIRVHTGAHWAILAHVGAYWSIFCHSWPYSFNAILGYTGCARIYCVAMLVKIILDHLEPYASIFNHYLPYSHSCLTGRYWNILARTWSQCAMLIILDHIGPYWTIQCQHSNMFGHIRQFSITLRHIGRYWAIHGHPWPYWTILSILNRYRKRT